VRGIIEGGAKHSAVDAYRGQYERARLKRSADAAWAVVDVLLLPTIPTHR